jgi:signal transduction histidine kinase
LTGGIAHDFNNMLAAILGNLELVEPLVEDDPNVAKRVGKAIGAVQKGATLVSRLLAFSRKQALEPIPTDVNVLIREIGELMKRTLGEQVEIELDLAQDIWPASVDRNQMDNAILNLAINARDAMPGGGTLTISTRNATLDGTPPVDHPDAPRGDFVAVSVSDSGCGMPPAVLASAFEPFFTTKEVGVGSGLGLSMVYGFVKQSGGHVHIDSEPDAGTAVTLYLPRFSEN